MSKVLIIPDLHNPVAHPGALAFCRDLRNKFKCNEIVCIGDIVDMQAISFHANNPQCAGALDEYHLAKRAIQKWRRISPCKTGYSKMATSLSKNESLSRQPRY